MRDIRAFHWTIYHPTNHTIDYYFAAEDWLMPYGNSLNGISLQAPLLVTVRAYGSHAKGIAVSKVGSRLGGSQFKSLARRFQIMSAFKLLLNLQDRKRHETKDKKL